MRTCKRQLREQVNHRTLTQHLSITKVYCCKSYRVVKALSHDLRGIEYVDPNQVQLLSDKVPAATPLHGCKDGIRHTGKQRAAVLVD